MCGSFRPSNLVVCEVYRFNKSTYPLVPSEENQLQYIEDYIEARLIGFI
jgi:hypothetical protein